MSYCSPSSLALTGAAVLLLFGSPAAASDREFCFNGAGIRAIEACERALQKSGDTLEIYRTLGALLESSGNNRKAVSVYRRGLAAYPDDRQLINRLRIAESNLQEQQWLEDQRGSSADLDAAAARAEFKINRIRCLTREGNEALEACRAAVTVAPGDAELAARYAKLQKPKERITAQSLRTPSGRVTAPVQLAERDRWREIVAGVQAALTELGYAPGVVDGIPGRETKTALANYQRLRASSVNPDVIDEAVLSELQAAVIAKQQLMVRLDRAEAQIALQDLPAANAIMETLASETGGLPVVADRYRALSSQIRALEIEAESRQLTDRLRRALALGDIGSAKALLDKMPVAGADAEHVEGLRQEIALAERRQIRERAARQRAEQLRVWRQEAEGALNNDDLERALGFISKGLDLDPKDEALVELKKRVSDREQDLRIIAERKAERDRLERQRQAEQQAEAERKRELERQRQRRIEETRVAFDKALDRNDLEAASMYSRQMENLGVDKESLESMSHRMEVAELVAAIRDKLRRLGDVTSQSGQLDEQRAIYEEANALIRQAKVIAPANVDLAELEKRTAAQMNAHELRQAERDAQLQELSQLQKKIRERKRQFERLELKQASIEARRLLEAQRILEKVWVSR